MEDMIEKMIKMLRTSKKTVVFTGAGVSTLSGIQDFRGKDGLYKTIDADRMFDIQSFYENPAVYYGLAKDFIYGLEEKKPSIVHEMLAEWEEQGLIDSVITQNIDLLHSKAGSKKVFEIHGSPRVHYCVQCGHEEDFASIAKIVRSNELPKCIQCSHWMKPSITFFGESLPEKELKGAINAASSAELIIVLGSSLLVQPAASIPAYTLRNGGRLIIVNQGETPFDHHASMRFDDLQDTFELLKRKLKF